MKNKHGKKQQKAWLCAMVAGALLWHAPTDVQAEGEAEFAFEQVVVTANRVPTKLSQAAANVTVIDREQIENGHYHSLAEVLKQANGVEIRQQGFPGAEEYAWLNGEERVLILVDGRRMNLGKKPGIGQATYNLNAFPSLNNIERIEIVKGPSSAVYGSDAVGGVINIITRQGGEAYSSLDASFGSWGLKKYEFAAGGGEDGWKWFMTAGKTEQDHSTYKDFKTGKVKDMPNSFYDQKNMTLRIDKDLSDNQSLTFSAEHAADHKGQPYQALGYLYHNPLAYLDMLSNNWDLTYHMDKSSETPGYMRVYQNYHKYQSRDTYSGSGDSTYSNKETVAAWQDGWRLDEKNTLVGGVEWRNTRVKYDLTGDRELTNRSAYLEDRMQLHDKWTFTSGVRYDHHSAFGSKSTPRASLNYQMDNTTDVFVSWGKIFNAPLVDDLYWIEKGGSYTYGGITYYYKTVGNPDLKPETGQTTTIGINKKLGSKTSLKASYFQSKLNNAIVWDDYFDGNTNTTVYIPGNINKMRKRGAEIELRRAFSPNWSAIAGYSYLKAEKMEKNNADYILDTENAQPNGYRLGISYNDEKWNMDINGSGVAGLDTKGFSSSRYWVMDLAMNYSIDKNARAYFKVNNLTNQAYETRGDSDVGSYPMPARNYQLGVKYNF